jgi:hypothetical protein
MSPLVRAVQTAQILALVQELDVPSGPTGPAARHAGGRRSGS